MLQIDLLMIDVMRRAVWNHSCGLRIGQAHRVPFFNCHITAMVPPALSKK